MLNVPNPQWTVTSEAGYWAAARLLRQYDRRGAAGRVVAGAVPFVTAPVVPLAGSFATIYVGADLQAFHVALGVLIATATSMVGETLRRRRDWRSLLLKRLWTFQAPNLATGVLVNVRKEDSATAHAVIRADRLNPARTLLTGSPPTDAPTLTTQITVDEPEAWMTTPSDEARIRRIVALMKSAGLRARVAGIDVFPEGSGVPAGSRPERAVS